MENIDLSLINWSRAQFALTAMYHWLFVPMTLGLGLVIAIMETIYYKTGKVEWKRNTQFWMKLFGVNFAIGVATGLILEFEFGTNWSNYSWFVGDIFGAPLAIEGMLAFFMESTFIAVMFFGWNKVSKGFHLASTWLTVIGASLSALWILVANAWMQFPDGMHFNPDTMRNEMADFWAVLLSPVAINKFLHTVFSSWIVGAAFCVGVSAWFMLKKREWKLAVQSIRIAAVVGFSGALLTAITGDGSAHQVALRQPMKLAAMEGLYEGSTHAGLIGFGILNPSKTNWDDSIDPFHFKIEIPGMLSLLSFRDPDRYVPGIKDLMNGYEVVDDDSVRSVGLSADERMLRGKKAVEALAAYRAATELGRTSEASLHRDTLEANYAHFGYGFIPHKDHLIPNVPLTFYTFHLMVILGFFFLAFFPFVGYFAAKPWFRRNGLILRASIFSILLAYICSECGWIVAEVGRQPWVIQDIMPTFAAVSRLNTSTVQLTFLLFAVLFGILLIAEIGILLKQIKKGPDPVH
ncbi:MAG: cytochrome ubiquinol oxidase subunit I [Bacteroidales bacterium]